MRLLGDMSRLNARRFPDKTAFICRDEALTFGEADLLANRIANGLMAIGVTPGDRVAILATNGLHYFPISFGSAKSGAVFVTLNFRCTLDELAFMVDDSGSRLLFFSSEFKEAAEELLQRCPTLETIADVDVTFVGAGVAPGAAPFADQPETEPAVALDETAPFDITYTSGTTGRPKGVVLSHRAILSSACQVALGTGLRHEDRALVAVPLFHGGGLTVLGHSHLYLGASLVIMDRYVPAEAMAQMRAHDVTTFFGVATQYAMLLDLPELSTEALPRLRNAWYGAAPMPVELVNRVRAAWPSVELIQIYGQTETTVISVLDSESHATKLGSAGRELPGIEMRVVDDDGVDVPPGSVGEIVVRREFGMSGYFNNPEQTAEVIRGDWVFTGDMARIDEDRFITLVDRKRDVILSGGENIYPKEIEEILYQDDAVMEAAVIGISDPKWGETPLAFVVARRDRTIDLDRLEALCASQLARFKVPRNWLEVEELPRTTNGKVRKNVLRGWATEDRAAAAEARTR